MRHYPMMDFDGAISEAARWLESAESDVGDDFSDDLTGEPLPAPPGLDAAIALVREAVEKIEAARKLIAAAVAQDRDRYFEDDEMYGGRE